MTKTNYKEGIKTRDEVFKESYCLALANVEKEIDKLNKRRPICSRTLTCECILCELKQFLKHNRPQSPTPETYGGCPPVDSQSEQDVCLSGNRSAPAFEKGCSYGDVCKAERGIKGKGCKKTFLNNMDKIEICGRNKWLCPSCKEKK